MEPGNVLLLRHITRPQRRTAHFTRGEVKCYRSGPSIAGVLIVRGTLSGAKIVVFIWYVSLKVNVHFGGVWL